MRKLGSLGHPVVITALLLAGVLAGSLVRISPFSASGAAITALDIGLAASALLAVFSLADRRRRRDFVKFVRTDPIWRLSALFLFIALATLVVKAGSYPGREFLIAAAYLARLVTTIFVGWWIAFQAAKFRRPVLTGLGITAGLLMLLGFGQLGLVPSLKFAVEYGWDPHLGRLFSTFLDPNFFGLFAVLAMSVSFALYLKSPRARSARWPLLLFVASWAALYLAYSRSAWVAGLIAIPPIAWRFKKSLALGIAVLFIGALFLPTRLGDRFESTRGLIRTSDYEGKNYRCAGSDTRCDRSGSNRVFSLRQGLALAQEHAIDGVGYNAYGFALRREGISKASLKEHSASGSDSSLLNVWATTGIFGLAAFAAFLVAVFWRLWQARRGGGTAAWLSWGLFWFTLAWLAASFFNNALFYPFILVPWLMLVAVSGAVRSGRAP